MPVMQSPPGPRTIIDGREYLYFGGTGYLGLQGHPEVIRAACEAMQRYGLGSATARTGFGTTPPVLEVEQHSARWFAAESALYFASGFLGSQILVTAALRGFDAMFVDQCAHYSLFDAARLSGRPVFVFGHADAGALREALQRHLKPGERPLVASDGVFAALGDLAPVPDYWEVLASYPGSTLLLDDAHGVGVLGESGRGTWEHFGMAHELNGQMPGPDSTSSSVPQRLVTSTLSKAVGGFGGMIPGSAPFVGLLRSTPFYPGASAPPIPAAAASAKALEILQDEPERRTRLRENGKTLRAGLRRLGLAVDESPAPIVCLKLGSASNMRRLAHELENRRILVPYMAAYSGLGPEGAFRLAVFATHTPPMLEQLVDALARLL